MLTLFQVENKLDEFESALGITVPREELPEANGRDGDGNALWREDALAAFMATCARFHTACNAVARGNTSLVN